MSKTKILEAVKEKISIKIEKPINPAEFFQNRKGLYVFSGFKERIIEKAKPVKTTEFSLVSFMLIEASYDKDIEKALPKKHIFKEGDVCSIISDLISKQPNGEEGTLLNDGYANLFYTKSFVVSVYWGSYDGEWIVSTWRRDDFLVGSCLSCLLSRNRNYQISSAFLVEVFVSSPFFQPPTCLPISCISLEISVYLLSSNTFNSHAILRKNFNVSIPERAFSSVGIF